MAMDTGTTSLLAHLNPTTALGRDLPGEIDSAVLIQMVMDKVTISILAFGILKFGNMTLTELIAE